MLANAGIGRHYALVAAVLFSAWLFVVVASGAGWNPLGRPWNFSNPGAFGDAFGPLNSLMAGLAAIAAIAAYRLQAKEIAAARKRQSEQDKALSEERNENLIRQERVEAQARKAAFESTFFQLLGAFRKIVESVDVSRSGGGDRTAHDAFGAMVGQLESTFHMLSGNRKAAWISISDKFRNDLNHYFRFLYHVVKFVDGFAGEDAYFYVRLIRAMLSESELILLANNCAHGDGHEKFLPLVEKYSLLHNISEKSIATWSLRDYFRESAFNLEGE